MTNRLQDSKTQVAVEMWRYDPRILATGHSVDALSLALTLKDDTDERVEQAVEELLSEVWRKIDGRKYKVVTLCGSTRFKEQFMDAQKRLTLAGYIVISVGLFGHAGDQEVWDGMDEGTLSKRRKCSTTCTNGKSTWLTKSTSSTSAATSVTAPARKSSTPKSTGNRSGTTRTSVNRRC